MSEQAAATGYGLPVRLRLKPPGPTTGYVDGGWWPRSRDLATELHTLLPAVAPRLGLVERVSYHLPDWDPTVRKIHLDGSLVRLGGYRNQHPNTVDLVSARQVFTLLVVPPQSSSDSARRALTAAAEAGNTDRVEKLLETTRTPQVVHMANGGTPAAEQRWESEPPAPEWRPRPHGRAPRTSEVLRPYHLGSRHFTLAFMTMTRTRHKSGIARTEPDSNVQGVDEFPHPPRPI